MLLFLAGCLFLYGATFFRCRRLHAIQPWCSGCRLVRHALQIWKTAEDINAWIAANFSYDMARGVRLSETQRTKNEEFSIYPPSEFFNTKTGVCVDLSRFGVETLRRIDPQSDPKYLMIEFDPIQIAGNTLRRHWLVSFKRNGKSYFFADSKRRISRYKDAREFITICAIQRAKDRDFQN
jgi:hypothetical protein